MNRAVLGKDGDAAFALKIVGIHDQFGDLVALAESAALAQQMVGQRGFAVVNVGDDGDIYDFKHILL